MRRFVIPLVFVVLIVLAGALPVAASSGNSNTPDHVGKQCAFS